MSNGDKTPGEAITWPMERIARLMRAREHDQGLNPAQWEALRFLAKANRFSNSPGALTRYLGATKGTISQTVKALERKGFVSKGERPGEGRSVVLELTAKGKSAIASDPWNELIAATEYLGGKTRRRLAKGLRELLAAKLKSGGHETFGICASCRYFRERGHDGHPKGPHFCMLLEEPLSFEDSGKICVEHEAA